MPALFSAVFKGWVKIGVGLGVIAATSCGLAQVVDHAQAMRPNNYDQRGNLITSSEQREKDREAGILQRGGHDPKAAAEAAAERAWRARAKNAPTLTNTNASAPNPDSVSARNIYRCKEHGTDVYADDENKHKFTQCILVRKGRGESEQQSPAPPPTPAVEPQLTVPSCSGALIYQGNTYIFSEYEPCPIPAIIFQNRRPLEANPSYYHTP